MKKATKPPVIPFEKSTKKRVVFSNPFTGKTKEEILRLIDGTKRTLTERSLAGLEKTLRSLKKNVLKLTKSGDSDIASAAKNLIQLFKDKNI